jgi:hypothetical protein
LPADQLDNNILKGELSSSAVVEPATKPQVRIWKQLIRNMKAINGAWALQCFYAATTRLIAEHSPVRMQE